MGVTVLQVAAGLSAALVTKLVLQKYVALKALAPSLRASPGEFIIWQEPVGPASIATGPIFPPRGWIGDWFAKFSLYAKYGSTCLSSINFWDGVPVFWLADADAIKIVQTSRTTFTKDAAVYALVSFWGQNVITTEGSDWRRHRSVANSAFNETNNALVWREAFRAVHEWFSEIQPTPESQSEPSVDLLHSFIQITLLVISRAGFGRRASWKEDSSTEPPLGHKLPFKTALISTIEHLFAKVLAPEWMHSLSSIISIPFISDHLADTRASFDALRMHMLDVVGSARDCVAGGNQSTMDAALLRNLVEANMSEEGAGHRHLTDSELLSNTFAFYMAGHDTSSHSLCFAAALLALYPNAQQRAYEETFRLWPEGVPPCDSPPPYKESMAQLEYITATFLEALRLFPPAPRLPRRIVADTTLKARRFSANSDNKLSDIEEYEVPVKAGGMVVMDILALHMNPIHWGDDVAEFRPERFIDTETYKWPRDAFQAFSGGARSCIGQRFALTEGVCILAQLVRKYEICIPAELRNRPFAEQKSTLLKWKPWMTMTPLNAKVVLRPRI